MRIGRLGIAAVAAALAVAGCSGGSLFGGPKKDAGPPPDPNLYPTNYRKQLAEFLNTVLRDRADFRATFIAQPVLMQTGDQQHYVVCIQLDGHNQHKDKVALFLAGNINQFIDATPEQCANAHYEPFTELAAMTPK